jgi:hypothetical protein
MMLLNYKLYIQQQIFQQDKIHIRIANKRNRYLTTKTLIYVAMNVYHTGRHLNVFHNLISNYDRYSISTDNLLQCPIFVFATYWTVIYTYIYAKNPSNSLCLFPNEVALLRLIL